MMEDHARYKQQVKTHLGPALMRELQKIFDQRHIVLGLPVRDKDEVEEEIEPVSFGRAAEIQESLSELHQNLAALQGHMP